MQLEALEQHWRLLDQKLDRSLALETELVRQVVLQPARQRVRRLAIWPAIDVAFCIGGLLIVGAFVSRQWHDWRLVLPASVVAVSFLTLLLDSVWQLERLSTVDWSGPVAVIQGSLERLRVAKIRQFKWIMLLSPLVGFCGLLVAVQGVLNWVSGGRADLLSKLDGGWIVGNIVFGVLFVPLGDFIARKLGQKCHRHRWWQSVLDGISGTSLKAATQEVDRWASLQTDDDNRSQ